jgi:L-malate glycosyltransferase
LLDMPMHGLHRLWRWKPDVLCVGEGTAFNSSADEDFLYLMERRKIPYVIVCQANWPQNVPGDRQREAARRVYAKARRVVFVAEENWRTAEKQLASRIENGVVLCSPVAPERAGLIAFPVSDVVTFAMVARLDIHAKGHDLAFEVLSRPQWTAREWTLDLYGEGPSRSYLTELARYFGISARVRFRGHEPELKRMWEHNQLLLLPSRAEGTPIALIEAMLCGRPSVVTDVGGNAAWVRNGVDGFVAPAATADLIAEALERAWQAKAAWRDIGLAARQRALGLYDPDLGATLLKLVAEAVPARASATDP